MYSTLKIVVVSRILEFVFSESLFSSANISINIIFKCWQSKIYSYLVHTLVVDFGSIWEWLICLPSGHAMC